MIALRWVLFAPACALLSSAAAGCGSGAPAGPGGSGGAGAASASALYRPCGDAARVGRFSVELVEPENGSPGYTSIGGAVRDGVVPADVWREVAKDGDCRLIVGPMLVCTTACVNPRICAGQNRCIDEPRARNVGTVTVSGVGSSAVTAAPLGSSNAYSTSVEAPYPPFAPGAAVTLRSGGGDYPAFTLTGRGVPEIVFDASALMVVRNRSLPITWTAPARPGPARVFASLDIAHHGGVSARIECDFADDGSGEMPAALISQLIDRGTAGFPELTLTRWTVDSTTIAPGCVELQVAAVAAQFVMVEGVTSCPAGTTCPGGQACPSNLKCP